ncbi:brain acid soluble protein 1-like [Manduca sexta]|uniref:brain acid soluble protein 1-like n=1 Tax=Manduca sexta TaxID=7130 RepID=UPI00188E6030|nr:brain acid soluble protein 1-like [Manduca sexta]
MKTIEEEKTALKRRLEELEAAAKGPTTEEMLAMVEARVQARMESILMGPTQRPPLAHEKSHSRGCPTPSERWVCWLGTHAKPRKEKGKGGKKTAQPAQAPAPAPTIPAPIAGPSSAPPQAVAGPSTAAASTPAMAPASEKTRRAPRLQSRHQAPSRRRAEERAGSSTRAGAPSAAAGPDSMETPWVEVARRKEKGEDDSSANNNAAQPPKPLRAERNPNCDRHDLRPW